jgi:hypothetical protein
MKKKPKKKGKQMTKAAKYDVQPSGKGKLEGTKFGWLV